MFSKIIHKIKLLNKKRRVNKVAKKLGLENYESVEDLFTDYYRNRTWSGGKSETVSGSGSTLKKTQVLRQQLPALLKRHDIKTLFDAPCGDFNWFRHIERGDVRYIGGDIVADMVNQNQTKYGDNNTSFCHFDILKDSAPEADLWFCREVLLHFSYDLIFKFFDNFINSQIPLLLISTHHEFKENIDIPTGAGRPVNLQISPFNFPPPIDFVEDEVSGRRPMRMGLWERATLDSHLRTIQRR